jgi:16S rRNA (uracil1498-N3)-methyltransferase
VSESRVYVDMELAEGQLLTLPAGAYQHLVVVLRRIPGDRVVLFNGRGGEYSVSIESVARRALTVRVNGFRDIARESPLQVTLGQAVSKGERMDYAIQKAVELGVTAIQPLITDHVVVRLNAERWERKCEHWQAIALSASEQCGRTRVPQIAAPLDLRDWITRAPPDALKLVLSLAPGSLPVSSLKHHGQPVWLLVGPEGDLSEVELQLTDLAGFSNITLGPRTLRTETAGVVALSVLQSLWGDLGTLKKK